MILEGQTATTPSQPTLTRSGNIYDLRLANITVSAGITRITADKITDTRFTDECGNVVQAVQSLSTEDIFKQYNTWFTTWFDNVKGQLSTDVAGNLQNQIDEINDKFIFDTTVIEVEEEE